MTTTFVHYVEEGSTLRICLPRGDILMDAADRAVVEGVCMAITTLGHATTRPPRTMRYQYLARLIMKPTKNEIVQYRNGNKLDCRRDNIVLVTRYDVEQCAEGELLRLKMKDGKEILMDVEDRALLEGKRVKIDERGYVRLVTLVPYGFIRLARAVMHTPAGLHCDHINGDKLDNRKANLRNCTCAENAHNRRGQRDCPNPYKGINYCEKRKGPKKWESHIVVNGRRWKLGDFLTAEEAATAYNKKALELCGQFARINVLNTPKKTVSVMNLEV